MTKEEITALKGRGFLQNRGTECFSGRVVTVAGMFSPEELRTLAECAERFGNGKVIMTSRLSAEIVGIPFDKVPQAEALLASHGMAFGGTGAKVRPITACKGTTCVYGNIDTQGLAKVLFDRFYLGMQQVALPHKFKIGVGGCPNSCMKPSLNDVGVEGCRVFDVQTDRCRGCKTCVVAERCPSHAVTSCNGKAVLDPTKCKKCGVCVGKCPFGAFPKEAESRCRLFVGGTWGKTWRMGTLLSTLYTVEEIPDAVEKIMLWYRENGYSKERLGATVDRLGVEQLERAIATEDLLERKEEILAKPILVKKEKPDQSK